MSLNDGEDAYCRHNVCQISRVYTLPLTVTAQHGSSRTTADQLDHKHLHKALG